MSTREYPCTDAGTVPARSECACSTISTPASTTPLPRTACRCSDPNSRSPCHTRLRVRSRLRLRMSVHVDCAESVCAFANRLLRRTVARTRSPRCACSRHRPSLCQSSRTRRRCTRLPALCWEYCARVRLATAGCPVPCLTEHHVAPDTVGVGCDVARKTTRRWRCARRHRHALRCGRFGTHTHVQSTHAHTRTHARTHARTA